MKRNGDSEIRLSDYKHIGPRLKNKNDASLQRRMKLSNYFFFLGLQAVTACTLHTSFDKLRGDLEPGANRQLRFTKDSQNKTPKSTANAVGLKFQPTCQNIVFLREAFTSSLHSARPAAVLF